MSNSLSVRFACRRGTSLHPAMTGLDSVSHASQRATEWKQGKTPARNAAAFSDGVAIATGHPMRVG